MTKYTTNYNTNANRYATQYAAKMMPVETEPVVSAPVASNIRNLCKDRYGSNK